MRKKKFFNAEIFKELFMFEYASEKLYENVSFGRRNDHILEPKIRIFDHFFFYTQLSNTIGTTCMDVCFVV